MGWERRQQRRQGVVYGPVFPRDGGFRWGALIGRLLGAVVVVATLGVLAVAAMTLINERSASGTATPSPTPTTTTSPAASVDVGPTPTGPAPTGPASSPGPSISPSDSPSPSPVPSASPVVPAVQFGPGFVTFGTHNDAQLHITDPRVSFASNERITMSIYLSTTADSADLRALILKLDVSAVGGERLIHDDPVSPAASGAQLFLRKIRPWRYLDGPGVYVVRYVRSDQVLSEGYFEITG